MDVRQARIIVVPVAPATFAPGKAPQLWLLPLGQRPISVGMIAANTPTALKLDRALLAQLGPSAALAVSVEPTGGSPTGQPTGPVVATGAIGAAKGRARGCPKAAIVRGQRTCSTYELLPAIGNQETRLHNHPRCDKQAHGLIEPPVCVE
jgi:hypothetical protein